MNVLSIGNSFSQDATRYLHGISKSAGISLNTVNLYIGGCPLSLHYTNIKGDFKAYSFEFNGQSTGFNLAIREALLNRHWNVVTIQQVSIESPNYDTYQPYLNFCVDYIREYCPMAKVYIQETWGYENGSTPLLERTNFKSTKDMFSCIKASYEKAAKDSGADGLIPSGEVMLALSEQGHKMYRDGFHASLGLGRYALGLTWFSYLTKKSADDVTFCDFDEPISEQEIDAAKNAVKQILSI